MMAQRRLERVAAALICSALLAAPALAQITTGNVAGTVKDAQGGVVPGATVVLVSETKGTKSSPAVTSTTGDYVFPNVTADTYTIEVTMEGFKTLTRKGVRVSGGDRVAVPSMTIEVGGAAETVNVSAEAALVQSQSGERSFAVTTEQVENLPINHANFTSLTAFVPGVRSGGDSAGGTRLGGVGQNNIQMDGVSAMDAQHEHRVHRRGQDPHPGLSGRVRAVERPADHGRHQKRHEPVPGIGLRRPDRLGLERELLGP